MKHLAYLNKFIWKYRYRYLLGFLFVALANWFRVLQPKTVGKALDAVLEKVNFYKANGGLAAHPEAMDAIGWEVMQFGGLVILMALAMGVFMFFMRQTIIVNSRLIEQDLRNEIFAHYKRADQAFFRKNNTGDLLSRVTEDVGKVRMYLGPAVLYAIDLTFLFVLTISAMLQVSVSLTLWALLPLPLLSVSIYIVSSIINKKSEQIQQQLASLTSTTQEVYSGIRVVKGYVQEAAMTNWFKSQSEQYFQRSLGLIRVEAFFHPLMIMLIGASIIIAVYVGGLQVVAGKISAGDIAAFVIYITMLTWPVTAIGWIASLTQQAAASQKRINEFLKIEPEIKHEAGKHIGVLKGDIEFDHVNFVYPDTGIQALHDVSFTVNQGEKIAILGRTGSGKTTIAELLVRLFDVEDGSVNLDGLPLKEHDLHNLRRRIGYVPQDVFLFSDTIYNNIAFGNPDLSREDAEFFARKAAVHEDIIGLPKGYDTLTGERGVTLSGGQKQRISLARAFAKLPDIIILDDCLSAVDTNTENLISAYLQEALSGKTAIIITHRIYSNLSFDKIIVLDQGRKVQEGTHESLMKQGGYYADMVDNQSLAE